MCEMINPYEGGHPIKEEMDFMKDRNCCTVVALACVTGYNFKDCYRHMSNYGNRVRGRGMFREEQVDAFKCLQGFKLVKSPYSKQNRITLGQFIKKHPKGRFYCASKGHAFSVIDGVLYDHCEKLRRQITFSYRFYNTQDLEELYNGRN